MRRRRATTDAVTDLASSVEESSVDHREPDWNERTTQDVDEKDQGECPDPLDDPAYASEPAHDGGRDEDGDHRPEREEGSLEPLRNNEQVAAERYGQSGSSQADRPA